MRRVDRNRITPFSTPPGRRVDFVAAALNLTSLLQIHKPPFFTCWKLNKSYAVPPGRSRLAVSGNAVKDFCSRIRKNSGVFVTHPKSCDSGYGMNNADSP